jgi:hypothetical protein
LSTDKNNLNPKAMLKEKLLVITLTISLVLITACGQNKVAEIEVQNNLNVEAVAVNEVKKPAHRELHKYSGWYCPDNLRGFPPIDIQNFEQVSVIRDRLPTKEETRTGASLMFFDPTEFPNATPLDIKLPSVAKIYSFQSNMEELVIVIQAVVSGKDTVVGFRYPNGGNGTSCFQEVTFLSDNEVKKIGPAPFVYVSTEIAASKQEIWNAITQTKYMKDLAVKFDKAAFFESDWNNESSTKLNFNAFGMKARGVVSSLWGNLYIHIDYDTNDFHSSEKMLVFANEKNDSAYIHFVSGPHPSGFEQENEKWKNWLAEVKGLSENSKWIRNYTK